MFHPSEAGRDVDMQREGSRGQAKRLFLSDVVSFLSRIFRESKGHPDRLFRSFRSPKSANFA